MRPEDGYKLWDRSHQRPAQQVRGLLSGCRASPKDLSFNLDVGRLELGLTWINSH
jgi:hypothetical protein